MKRFVGKLWLIGLLLLFGGSIASAATSPLTTLDFNIVGIGLNAGPDYQAVPKGVATRVNTSVDTGNFDVDLIVSQLPKDYRVKAELSGPAFLTPITLETLPGKPFDIPTLALTGRHSLTNIRLEDGKGRTLFGAVPQAVVIESINDPLITEVRTRELTAQELQDRGVTFDSSNFTAYEFTAAIATESGQVPLNLPVIIPDQVTLLNPEDIRVPEQVGLPVPQVEIKPPEGVKVQLPPNLEVLPVMVQLKEPLEGDPTFKLPPIPGVVVIPGNIGFLHQYFSALAIVTNGAPELSDLTIRDVRARIKLPAGEDLTPGTDAAPGDDPLRLAKGTDGFFPREMIVNQAGPDGQYGTADDVSSLQPGESGQADFTIEGLKEGTHKIEFEITATLDGLPVGPVELTGTATGAVLVRNPEFALTMSHPQTVRAGETYDLFVTVTNTGKSIANLVSVHLDPRALSGAVFTEGTSPDQELASIAPGSSGTVRYRLIAQRTGAVTATVFQSEELKGRFILRSGVGEKGIPLSPDSLILPYTDGLTPELVEAVVGLLGQAWSVATAPAGALPADVAPIARQTVRDRAYDLSEAGLRILIGDQPHKALEDLIFDLFGSDKAFPGFDALRRSSEQGRKVTQALTPYLQAVVDDQGLLGLQADWADKVSYRPGHLSVATTAAPLRLQLRDPAGNLLGSLDGAALHRDIPYGDIFTLSESGSDRANLALVTAVQSGAYRLDLVAEAAASCDLGIIWPDADGTLRQLLFNGLDLPAGARAQLVLQPGMTDGYQLQVDLDADGSIDATVNQSGVRVIADTPPRVVAATQIVPGFGPGGDKHGRNIAVLFDETVSEASARDAAHYLVDANQVKSATLQPGNRMVFLLLRDGIGPFFERTLSVDGLVDSAGQSMLAPESLPVRTTATGPAAVVDGVVREANGRPIPGATVRLMQYIWYDDGISIEQVYAIFSEKQAGPDGSYHFDYVLQNADPAGPFRIEAVHPDTGEVGQVTTAVLNHGQRLNLDIFMKARGSLSGTVFDDTGAPLAGATVQVTTLTDQRRFSRTTDAQGHYAFGNLTVGAFSLKGIHQATLSEGTVMGTLPDDGVAVEQDLTLSLLDGIARGNVAGKVLGPDGITPRSNVVVIVRGDKYTNWVRSAGDGSFSFAGVYAGPVTFEAYDESSGEQIRVQGAVLEGRTSSISLIFEGTGNITGSVSRDDGKSVSGLLVAASFGLSPYRQTRLVETDSAGRYRFDALPVGAVELLVIDPNDYNKRVAQTHVTLLNHGDTLVVPLYVPAAAFATGTLTGTVYHRDGTPWPGAEVRLADLNAHTYIPYRTDSTGRYLIPNLPLKTYHLILTQQGEVANATATLWYDGQSKTVDLHPYRFGTISGTVYDDPEKTQPTGADVTLTAMQPNFMGWLVFDTNHPQTIKADPQTGRFTFDHVYEGHYVVRASNVFRPIPVSVSGSLAALQTVDFNLVLQGSVVQDPNPDPNPDPGQPRANAMGAIAGRVLLPDGSVAGSGVRVTTTIGGGDVTVTTDGNGEYRFSPIIPQGNHVLRAFDPVTTLQWQGYVSVPAGGEVNRTIALLGRGGLRVTVTNADGTPAPDATVTVTGSDYPNDKASAVSDADGLVILENLTVGRYAIAASGSFGRGGRGEAIIDQDGAVTVVTVPLTPTGTVTGIFLKADGVTPIGGGQIKLRRGSQTLAFTSSSVDPLDPGRFRLDHVPLGDFILEGFDPTSQRSGRGSGRLARDGETADIKVMVLPRGTVRGAVLNFGGTAPIERADVRISVNGASGYNYSTTTGSDGSYIFTGVPAGRFQLDATDPDNGLKASASGTLSYENETVTAELRIAPTGTIEGQVLLPDGVTPATSARVVFNGKSYLVDAVDGRFAFTNLPAGHSYTLTAFENNSHRAQSRTVTLAGDGELVVAQIVLRGIGMVSGTIFDTDGGTPLAGALVKIHASGLAAADYAVYSDSAGQYQFSDVPAGNFTLKVTHPQRVTAAAASGVLNREGETVTRNLVIGPVASVTGRVLLADGLTPASGGGVKYSDDGHRTFTALIDADGYFRFDNIPVPANFELYLADAQDQGFNRTAGSLTDNGQVYDVGTVVLDDRDISVVSVDPSPGSVDVAVDRPVTVVFSEPFDLATVNSNTVYLTREGTRVPAVYGVGMDGRTLTLTPNAPLNGFALYKLVVSRDVKDLVGRALPSTFVSTFTTVDNVPPALVSVAPADGAIQVPLDGVVRLSFSESLDPATLNGITLLREGVPVAARLDLIQEGRVVVLTPLSPLSANGRYTVSVADVRDIPGNRMPQSFHSAFSTLDTIPPQVSELTLAAGARLINGSEVNVSAVVNDADVAFVDFSVDDVLAATDRDAPFSASLPLDHAGELVIKAVAQDRVGNRGPARLLVVNVAEDQPPTATIIAPVDGSVADSGTALDVTIDARDDLGLKAVTLSTSGALTFKQTRLVVGTAATARFTLTVPGSAVPGSSLILNAETTDSIGQTSPVAVAVLTVRDNTRPELALTSPGETALYRPGEAGRASLAVSDNHALAGIDCTVAGAADGNFSETITPPQSALEREMTFTVAADAEPFAPIQVVCTARDLSGNERTATLPLQVADVVPPQVIASTPVDGAIDVPTVSALRIRFDEPLLAASVTSSAVALTSADGGEIDHSVALSSSGRELTITPTVPLSVGMTYRLTLDTTLADRSGNLLASPYVLNFTTDAAGPRIVSVSPQADAQNVAVGTSIGISYNEPLDPDSLGAGFFQLSTEFGPVAGSVQLSADGKTVVFKPFGILAYNRVYTMNVSAGVRDLSGNAGSDSYAYSFTTGMSDPDLVGRWAMDGDWSDASGNGFNGTPAGGATFTGDRVEGAAAGDFSGAGDYVAVGNLYGNFPGNTISIETWVKLNDTGNGGRRSFAGGTGRYADYSIGLASNKFTVFVADGAKVTHAFSRAVPRLGEWYHVVGTYDGAKLKLYVNGQLESSVDAQWRQADGGVDFYLGNEYCCGNNFNGLLDEVSLYRRSLSSADVFEHYNAGLTGDRLPPALPTVNPVDSPTFGTMLVLSGTKETGTSIRVNGKQIVSHDESTTWMGFYSLLPGQNILEITSRDRAGNASNPVALSVDLLPANQRDPDIVGYWPMNGHWLDYSGNGFNGNPVGGVAFTIDHIDGPTMGDFSGAGDYVAIGNLYGNFPQNRFSIATWVKLDDTGNGGRRTFAGGVGVGSDYAIGITENRFTTYVYNKAGGFYVTSGFVPEVGRWYHVAGTFDGGTLRLYVDGKLAGEKAASWVQNDGGVDFWIGQEDCCGNNFNGLLYDVKVYRWDLSATEITEIASTPTVVLSSLGQSQQYLPGETGIATYTVIHPQGIESLQCNASGSASGFESVAVTGGQTEITGNFTFAVSDKALPCAPIRITCVATDVRGHIGVGSLDLVAADIVPPEIVSSWAEDGATDVSAVEDPRVTFSEPLRAASVNAMTVQLFDQTTGLEVPGKVRLSADGRKVVFDPDFALAGDGFFVLKIMPGIQDLAGNLFQAETNIAFQTSPAQSLDIANQGSSSTPYVIQSGRYTNINVSGSFVVFSGKVAADEIHLLDGSVLTHAYTDLNTAASLQVEAATVVIDATSRIDVTGRGYLGGHRGGNNTNWGRTQGNTTSGGSDQYNGGSYGGLGGRYSSNYSLGGAYGDPTDPNEPGSGGGANGSGQPGGNGGGLIRLQAGSLILDGTIVADGWNGNFYGGGGSGGGIRLDVGTLRGGGAIRARGGGSPNGGAGGGGRIAIYYQDLQLPVANISAASGAANNGNGGAGTIYLKSSVQAHGELIVDNLGTRAGEGSTPLSSVGRGLILAVGSNSLTRSEGTWKPGSLKGLRVKPDITQDTVLTVVDNDATTLYFDPMEGDLSQVTGVGSTYSGVLQLDQLAVRGKARVSIGGQMRIFGRLELDDGGLVNDDVAAASAGLINGSYLAHWFSNTGTEHRLNVSIAGELTIDATSRIDVTGRGYLGGHRGGNNTNWGRTQGNTTSGGSDQYNGGSYGGLGGRYSSNYSLGGAYGDPTDPNEPGSGGGANGSGQLGGNGGGLIRLQAGSLILDGTIVADGWNGNFYGGGGSGGGIRLDVGTLSGGGAIRARGGGSPNGGAGGGGRIAIYYQDLQLPVANISAVGGAGMAPGGNGTVSLFDIR